MRFRCSELDRVFSCHGSITAVPLVPRRISTEGDEGSQLHYLIAKKLVDEHGAIAPEGGLQKPKLAPGFKLSPFAAWIVDWAVRHILESVPKDWSILVEQEFAYEYQLPRPTVVDGVLVKVIVLTGHIDVMAMNPAGDEFLGFDWKTGVVGADSAENNWQAAGYLGLAKLAWPEIKKASFTLAQPRIDEDAGIQRISTTTLDGDGLDQLNATLAEQFNLAIEDRFTTDSGIKQCKYCPVGLRCPSIQAEVQLMKATLTPDLIERLKRTPSDTELAEFVISGRTITGPLEAAEELLHERLDVVGNIPTGRITVSRRTQGGHYEINDPVQFMQALRVVLPSDESIYKVVKPSMSRIKDEIAAVQDIPKTSKHGTSAQSVFDGHLRPLCTQHQKKILVFT